MALKFRPDPGTLLICDFSVGFQPPEIVKKRPVVVLAASSTVPLVSVVCLSTQAPDPVLAWHHRMASASMRHLRPSWAKCDLVYTVAWARLDRILLKAGGVRTYTHWPVTVGDFAAIQEGVRRALGLAQA